MDPYEAIYAALFALVSGAGAFKTASRLWKMWDQVADQPAVFQVQLDETVRQQFPGMPEKYDLHVAIWVYASTSSEDGDLPPSSVLNPLLTAIKTALLPPMRGAPQTLGFPGQVESAYIDGAIKIWEGALGQQAIARIPVTIECGDLALGN